MGCAYMDLDIVIFIAIQRFKTKIWTIRQLTCTSNDMWRKLSIAIQYGFLQLNMSSEREREREREREICGLERRNGSVVT